MVPVTGFYQRLPDKAGDSHQRFIVKAPPHKVILAFPLPQKGGIFLHGSRHFFGNPVKSLRIRLESFPVKGVKGLGGPFRQGSKFHPITSWFTAMEKGTAQGRACSLP